jgi:hypothetical protein
MKEAYIRAMEGKEKKKGIISAILESMKKTGGC